MMPIDESDKSPASDKNEREKTVFRTVGDVCHLAACGF
jgi:hypothetical protein